METWNRMWYCLACVLIVCTEAIAQSDLAASAPEAYEERTICRDLCGVMIDWLEDANATAGAECDRLIDELLSLKKPSVKAYLVAAQSANLRGHSERAISILKKVVAEHPNESADIMHIPVKTLSYCWIATIARRSGSIGEARDAYAVAMESLNGTEGAEGFTIAIALHRAEMESSQEGREKQAIEILKACDRIREPSGRSGLHCRFYKLWAAHKITEATLGATRAGEVLTMQAPEIMAAPSMAASQLCLSGLTDVPLSDYSVDRRVNIVGETLLNRVMSSGGNTIDASCARLVYATSCERQRETSHAVEQYSQLFAEKSFFSPIAGFNLMRLRSASEDKVEAGKILEKMRSRYPALNGVVSEFARRHGVDAKQE